ncbi:MAG TPA: hypothetical protein VKA46_35745 [Gemmataceae bacterium]|nr:hypothetical protein [Gemmataceae bacterium]
MKLHNVMTVLGTAAVTVAVTLTFAALRPVGVAEAGGVVKPVIARPQLTSQGCTFVLKTDKASYEEGESPKIEVTATNPTDKPVNATVWVTVSATAPTARMSRMLPRPSTLSSQEFAFSLKADETKSMTLTCSAKLPPGQDVRIILSDKKNAVMATNVAVPSGGGFNQVPPGGPNAVPKR